MGGSKIVFNNLHNLSIVSALLNCNRDIDGSDFGSVFSREEKKREVTISEGDDLAHL